MHIRIFVLFLLIFFSVSTSAQSHKSCEELPASFPNYENAMQQIKVAEFKINETIDTRRSSWIRGLSYFSCDGKSGFMIMKTDSKSYIHQNVPIDIWNEVKNAESFGSYYNDKIKHLYQLSIK